MVGKEGSSRGVWVDGDRVNRRGNYGYRYGENVGFFFRFVEIYKKFWERYWIFRS